MNGCLPFEAMPIIEVPPFGNKCTETVWLQMKIKSQNEKDKVAEAKKQTYLKVKEAKPLIRSKLLETG
jgi:leucyl-tRNA synthetase